ncbi:MAG: hypothetical protein Kow00129_08610 [Thermoleophilia bacterium]
MSETPGGDLYRAAERQLRWPGVLLTWPRCAQLQAAGLREEALEAAESRSDVLHSMIDEDLLLWLEVAVLLDERNVRCPAHLLCRLADTLVLLEVRPDVRSLVHRTVRTLFERFPRLVVPYLRGVQVALRRSEEGTTALQTLSAGSLHLAGDPGLAQPYLEQAPFVLARRGVRFLTWWQEEAFLVAESDWWAARGFLSIGGRAAPLLRPTDLAPLGEVGVRIAARSRHGAKAFFGSVPTLRAVMPMQAIRRWADRAMVVCGREEDLVLYLSCPVRRAPGAYFARGDRR